jgi:hypothetical protein
MSEPISAALATFITSHISIHVAATRADGIATLVRALGCRIDPSAPARVRLLVARAQCAALLEAVATSGRIAAVFNEPESHRTVQLKGGDARVLAATPDDLAVRTPYVQAMARRLTVFDTPEPFMHALLASAPDEVAVVDFTPAAAFTQTPGPRAGAPLAPDAPQP